MQTHKKSSFLEFLRNNTFKFTRSIHRFSVFFLFLFFLIYLFFHYQGKTPYKIDRSVKKRQKAIITKHGKKYKNLMHRNSCSRNHTDNGNRCVGPDRLANLIRQKKTLALHHTVYFHFPKAWSLI